MEGPVQKQAQDGGIRLLLGFQMVRVVFVELPLSGMIQSVDFFRASDSRPILRRKARSHGSYLPGVVGSPGVRGRECRTSQPEEHFDGTGVKTEWFSMFDW